MKIREEVMEFSQKMEELLQKNDHKGHWNNNSIEFLFAKLIEEVGEVGKLLALTTGEGVEGGEVDDSEVYKECVDVANVAMMLASKYTGGPNDEGEEVA